MYQKLKIIGKKKNKIKQAELQWMKNPSQMNVHEIG
jgi:hypothetical protein